MNKKVIRYAAYLLDNFIQHYLTQFLNGFQDDMKLLTSLRDSIISKYSLPEKKIPEEILPMLFSELSPVAAIIGGVLGQEVIKVISNKDAPHNNFFLYNPLESCGVVEAIGY